MTDLTRREFSAVGASSVLAASSLAFTSPVHAESANEAVRVGVMGISGQGRGRGCTLARELAGLENVEIAALCDVDSRNLAPAVKAVMTKQKSEPTVTDDYRRILDDAEIDALVVAAPDHWHAPAGIAAMQAGKHVYVEKPCCHNPREGVWLAETAERTGKIFQHGTQRRSWPALREAIQRVHAGEIGRPVLAHCWYYNNRPAIGTGSVTAPPDWLNWKLWQGPAPEADFQSNLVHYNWHWFWKYGTGEVGNNGVHMIDVARWALGVGAPNRVTSGGGFYRDQPDDQQTPNDNMVHLDYGDRAIIWEGHSWQNRPATRTTADVIVSGTRGQLLVKGSDCVLIAANGSDQPESITGSGGNTTHVQNFIDSIRGEAEPHAPVGEAVHSALACHLGNIAYRVGRTLEYDDKAQSIVDDAEAMTLWGRDYRDSFRPNV